MLTSNKLVIVVNNLRTVNSSSDYGYQVGPFSLCSSIHIWEKDSLHFFCSASQFTFGWGWKCSHSGVVVRSKLIEFSRWHCKKWSLVQYWFTHSWNQNWCVSAASMNQTRISTEFNGLVTGHRHFEHVGFKLWVETRKSVCHNVIHRDGVSCTFCWTHELRSRQLD